MATKLFKAVTDCNCLPKLLKKKEINNYKPCQDCQKCEVCCAQIFSSILTKSDHNKSLDEHQTKTIKTAMIEFLPNVFFLCQKSIRSSASHMYT